MQTAIGKFELIYAIAQRLCKLMHFAYSLFAIFRVDGKHSTPKMDKFDLLTC